MQKLQTHFEERIQAFEAKGQKYLDELTEKKKAYDAELAQERQQLVAAYGEDIVNARLREIPRKSPSLSMQVPRTPQPRFATAPAASMEPAPKKVYKREKKIRPADVLKFVDTKLPVLEAIQSLPLGEEFTKHDVEQILKQKGFKTFPPYISLILSKRLNGLEQLPHKRSDHDIGRGQPQNVYLVTGVLSFK